MIIVSKNLEIHMEQAQCDQVVKIKVIKYDLTKLEQLNSDHNEHQFIILQEKVNCISFFKRFYLFYKKKKKNYFFYFTPSLLPNTYISLLFYKIFQ